MTCYAKTGNSATAGFKDGICTDCYTAAPNNPAWNGSTCTTCLAAEGASKPVYSDLAGRCVSCAEKDSSTPNWNGTECVGCSGDTPYWNGTACVGCSGDTPYWDGTQCVSCQDGYYKEDITCADGTEWNEETGKCEEIPANAIMISTDTDNFYIWAEMIFDPASMELGVSKSTCENMIASGNYPQITSCPVDNDYWAGASQYCQQQGKRLPTIEELNAIGNIFDEKIWDILSSAGYTGVSAQYVYFWSSKQADEDTSNLGGFTSYNNMYTYGLTALSRARTDIKAFCLPK